MGRIVACLARVGLVTQVAMNYEPEPAGIAQLVEQLIRNQQVVGSSPILGSP